MPRSRGRGTKNMAAVCCAAGALVLLSTDPNSTIAAKDVMKRCGKTCVGAGDTATQGPAGCEGLLYQPNPNGGECPINSTMLQNFQGNPRYGGTDRHGICKGPECPAVMGKTVKIHPRGGRPVRVRTVPAPNVPEAIQRADTLIQFKDNRIPSKSSVKGPLTIQCSGHGRIKIGAGTTLENIQLRNCNDTCPLNVELTRKDGNTHTSILGIRFQHHMSRSDVLAEASMCALLITPVSSKNHPRDFLGRGRVTFQTAFSHNVAIANVNGKVGIDNTDATGTSVVTLLDTIEDSNGRLELETPNPERVLLRNMTAIMDVFSQEYMVEYFGPSDQRRRDIDHLKHFNWTMLALLIALLSQTPKGVHTALKAE